VSLDKTTSAGAVIVAFHPSREALADLVRCYRQQLRHVVVVDNTPGGADLGLVVQESGGELLELGDNLGIGAALNRGIDRLMKCGCFWFFLSDQDSVPPADLAARLMTAFCRLQGFGLRVATVGALFLDPRTGHVSGFPRKNSCSNSHHVCPDWTGLVPASYVITSGSLVSRDAIETVGPMAEELFIDYVDIEWCFRAASRGYAVYGEPAAVIEHTLGDRTVSFWLFGRRQKALHSSPLRIYFQNRNYLLLCRLPHIGLCWKLLSLAKRTAAVLLYMVVARHRLAYLRSALKGFRDGLMGRTGAAGER